MTVIRGRCYLAVPYSHPAPDVRHARWCAANCETARLSRDGWLVYSPISMGHAVALAGDLPHDFAYWRDHCEWMLSACDTLVVLTIDGWRDSIGVTAEIAMAEERRLTIVYI